MEREWEPALQSSKAYSFSRSSIIIKIMKSVPYWKGIYSEFSTRYKIEGLSITNKTFENIASLAETDAIKSYKKLTKPRIVPKSTYIRYWIRESLNNDFAKRSIKGFDILKPPTNLKNIASFTQLLPPETVEKLHKQIYDSKPEDRGSIWKNLKVPVQKLDKKFTNVVIERNRNDKEKGYASTLDFHLKLDKIKVSECDYFNKHVDDVIKFCNKNLPEHKNFPQWFYSQYNNYPCFVCSMENFPFKDTKDVVEKMRKTYESLSKYRDHVEIVIDDTMNSSTFYVKETDKIKVMINGRQNTRHKCMDLIHELGHVISYINDFLENKIPGEEGRYHNEENAYKIEAQFLNSNYPELYKASLSFVLSNLARVLFEMEIYKNPVEEANILFARTFNRCFLNSHQKNNPLYLVERRILYQPFYTLAHAVSEVKVISNMTQAKV